jgi:hypothetical protein
MELILMSNLILKRKKSGFLVLTMVLIVSATVLIVATGVLLRSISDVNSTADSGKALQAWSTVNACGEYALGQMMGSTSATTTAINWGFASTTGVSLDVEDETCYIYPVEDLDGAKLIKASSTVASFTRKIEIEVATNTPSMVVTSWEYVADFRSI